MWLPWPDWTVRLVLFFAFVVCALCVLRAPSILDRPTFASIFSNDRFPSPFTIDIEDDGCQWSDNQSNLANGFPLKNEKEKFNFQMNEIDCVETKARKRIEFAYSLLLHIHTTISCRWIGRCVEEFRGILRTNKRRRGKAEQIATQMDERCALLEFIDSFRQWMACGFPHKKQCQSLRYHNEKNSLRFDHALRRRSPVDRFRFDDSYRRSGRRECIQIVWNWNVFFSLWDVGARKKSKELDQDWIVQITGFDAYAEC